MAGERVLVGNLALMRDRGIVLPDHLLAPPAQVCAVFVARAGVAMGSATDVARESADVVLLGNDLLKFAETLRIARRARRIIWANFAGTIGVDALGIGLAAFGLLNPMVAAFIHVASELAFILNSARLLACPGEARNVTPVPNDCFCFRKGFSPIS